MKLLSKALAEKEFDVRLRDKMLAEGKISKKAMDDYFKSLKDESGNYTNYEEDEVKSSSKITG